MNQPNAESGAEVRCPKCGSVETRPRIGSSVWDCACGVLFVPIKESMGKAALEEGCESVECGPPPAQSEAAEGKEAFDGHPIIKSALDDFGREVIASLQAQVEQLKRERDAANRKALAHFRDQLDAARSERDRRGEEVDQLRADVLRLESEKFEVQKELEVEIELRKEIGARLNLKCADIARLEKERDEARQLNHMQ